MLATISSGHLDFADICFLVAVILAAVASVFCVTKGAVESALGWGAIAFGMLGWLVL